MNAEVPSGNVEWEEGVVTYAGFAKPQTDH